MNLVCGLGIRKLFVWSRVLLGTFHAVSGSYRTMPCSLSPMEELSVWFQVVKKLSKQSWGLEGTFHAILGHYGNFLHSPGSLQELSMRSESIGELSVQF